MGIQRTPTLREQAEEIAGLEALLTNVEYIRLREKYDRGQLSFYSQITEFERTYVGRVITA